MPSLFKIQSTGVGLSLQDVEGRRGLRRFGVPSGGALDPKSARAANRLLGNHPNAPVLEILLQGARLELLRSSWVALAGAEFGGQLAAWTAERFAEGLVLEFPRNISGLLGYVAVPGGFETDRWFGSAASDLRNGMGRRLKKNMLLDSAEAEPRASVDRVSRRSLSWDERRDFSRPAVFEVFRGPQFDAFHASTKERFLEGPWEVSTQSDRTGYRLEGPELEVPASIPSAPVLPGSVQIPGNGFPIVTLNDGPTVGGYANLAILRDADVGRFAQCAPGTRVRFQWAD